MTCKGLFSVHKWRKHFWGVWKIGKQWCSLPRHALEGQQSSWVDIDLPPFLHCGFLHCIFLHCVFSPLCRSLPVLVKREKDWPSVTRRHPILSTIIFKAFLFFPIFFHLEGSIFFCFPSPATLYDLHTFDMMCHGHIFTQCHSSVIIMQIRAIHTMLGTQTSKQWSWSSEKNVIM